MVFKARGYYDPVAELDFLIRMFTLIETMSACKYCLADNYCRMIVFGGAFRTCLDC